MSPDMPPGNSRTPGAQPEATPLQIAFPRIIDFGHFAAQCRRPIGFARIDRATGIFSFLAMEETTFEPTGIG